MSEIMGSLAGHAKKSGFHCKGNGQPAEGFKE